MSAYTKDQISASKMAYGNPYAHIELCDEPESMADPKYIEASDEKVRASRRLLENQYAHHDGDGKYCALELSPKALKNVKVTVSKSLIGFERTSAKLSNEKAKVPRRYAEHEIQQIVRNLHKSLWNNKSHLWDGDIPNDPIKFLDPSLVLPFCGYSLEYLEGLPQDMKDGNLGEVAGLLDTTNKAVYISRQFKQEQQIFTAIHELGHGLLHRESIGPQHRDRPLDGTIISRDHIEREADKFAALFLMPEKLVKTHFSARFQTNQFKASEETAFGLGFLNKEELTKKVRSKKELARLLASNVQYHSRTFESLASQFRVSVGAMAIRLEELELVDF